MGNLASQDEPHRAPSLCSNVSLLVKSYILKVQRGVFQKSVYRKMLCFTSESAVASSTGNSFHFLSFSLDTEQLRCLDLLCVCLLFQQSFFIIHIVLQGWAYALLHVFASPLPLPHISVWKRGAIPRYSSHSSLITLLLIFTLVNRD